MQSYFIFFPLWMTVELMFLVVDVQHNLNRDAHIHGIFVDTYI